MLPGSGGARLATRRRILDMSSLTTRFGAQANRSSAATAAGSVDQVVPHFAASRASSSSSSLSKRSRHFIVL